MKSIFAVVMDFRYNGVDFRYTVVMDRHFQISLRNALVATGWVAAWLPAVAVAD